MRHAHTARHPPQIINTTKIFLNIAVRIIEEISRNKVSVLESALG